MKCRKQNNSASRNVVLHMKLNVHLGDLNNCILLLLHSSKGFPGSSVGKESACNAGDSVSIPRLGRSTGEWIGYPLQYSGLENFMDYRVANSQKLLSLSLFTPVN